MQTGAVQKLSTQAKNPLKTAKLLQYCAVPINRQLRKYGQLRLNIPYVMVRPREL